MDNRGQENAPFELLVAVILMGFVLLVGFNAMNRVSFDSCVQENSRVLEDFKVALEQTASGTNARTRLLLPECAPRRERLPDGEFRDVQFTRLVVEGDPARCAEYCTTTQTTCVLLTFYNPQYSEQKCVSVSSETVFPGEGGCDCPEGFAAVDLLESSRSAGTIPEGAYRFVNNTISSGSTIAQICACHEERG